MTRGKKHCNAKQIHESVLESISADVLEMTHFEADVFLREIDHVCIYNDHRVFFYLYCGREEECHWENPSRSASWTPEMKQRAAEHAGRRNVHV